MRQCQQSRYMIKTGEKFVWLDCAQRRTGLKSRTGKPTVERPYGWVMGAFPHGRRFGEENCVFFALNSKVLRHFCFSWKAQFYVLTLCVFTGLRLSFLRIFTDKFFSLFVPLFSPRLALTTHRKISRFPDGPVRHWLCDCALISRVTKNAQNFYWYSWSEHFMFFDMKMV